MKSIITIKKGWVKLLLILIIGLATSLSSYSQSVEYDKKIGAEYAEIVKTQMGLYKDVAMTDYITSIGNRLAAELDKTHFEFHIYRL